MFCTGPILLVRRENPSFLETSLELNTLATTTSKTECSMVGQTVGNTFLLPSDVPLDESDDLGHTPRLLADSNENPACQNLAMVVS